MTLVKLNAVTVSYPNLIEKDDNGKYTVTLLIDKTDKDTLIAAQTAVDNVRKAAISGKIKNLPANTTPLKDGNAKREDGSTPFAGYWYFNASNKQQPMVYDRNAREADPRTVQRDDVCRAIVDVYAYSGGKGMKPGITVKLESLTVLKSGRKDRIKQMATEGIEPTNEQETLDDVPF